MPELWEIIIGLAVGVLVILGHLYVDRRVTQSSKKVALGAAVSSDSGSDLLPNDEDPNQGLYDEIARAAGENVKDRPVPDDLPDRLVPPVPGSSEQLAVALRPNSPVLDEPDRTVGHGIALRSESLRDVARRYRTRTSKESD